MTITNRRLTDALKGQNQGRPPVWLMRQAGRYLPEYRAIKAKHSLLELFHNPELIAEITVQPIQILKVDAAILFSDILIVLDALNISYDFKEGVGPVIATPVTSSKDLDRLVKKDVAEALSFVFKAIRLIQPQLKVPLLGFCGAPFTVASYLIEGGTSRDFKKTKQWLYSDPDGFGRLIDLITDVTADYLKLQIQEGVHAVQIFDSWANILTEEDFQNYSIKPIQKLMERIEDRAPVILFCRNSSFYLEALASLRPAAISLDWQMKMSKARRCIGSKVALQGNLDPAIFYGSEEHLLKKADELLEEMKDDPGFIFNLGHGMLPDAPIEKVKLLIDYIVSR